MELLNSGRNVLAESGSRSPLLDSQLILGHLLGIRKETLYIRSEDPVPEDREFLFAEMIEKRRAGFPVAYLIQEKEFFGFPFFVKEGVLCPRPDTEILVEESLRLLEKLPGADVLDLCTGSGCVGLSLLKTRPDISLTASDISETAAEVFRINNGNLCGGAGRFVFSSYFDSITGQYDIITANPPYLTTEETRDRPQDIRMEPALALDGGADGLDPARVIITEAREHLKPGSRLLLEASPRQALPLREIMESSGYSEVRSVKDLAGYDRITMGKYVG